jgi:hypothetical protein
MPLDSRRKLKFYLKVKMKKLFLSILFLGNIYCSSAMQVLIHREKFFCLGNICAYTGRDIFDIGDVDGNGTQDLGVSIKCYGPGFSSCPRSIIAPNGNNDGNWDACLINGSETLIDYATNELANGNTSGEHTINVQGNGCSYTLKVVFSGNYSDPENSWDKMDIYII